MDYRDVMDMFSQSGMGALVLAEDGMILAVNGAGDRLLHGDGALTGQALAEIAPALCEKSDAPVYENISFGEYLMRCPAPEVTGLPPNGQLVVFRVATNDACHDMLISVLNQLGESVVLCDAKSRIYLLNDAAVKLDSMVTQDVLGETVADVYQMTDGKEIAIPRVIREKKPKVNHRQEYITRYGKKVTAISNTFPIVQNGQVLGAYNILEDWSASDYLHRQLIDLQEKLLAQEPNHDKKGKSVLAAKYTFSDIIHTSAGMQNVIEQCKQVSQSDSSVMLYGETGTGKELFAQSIHNFSKRKNGPFLAINCAALPDNLLEGLLFGTEKGAYTNAESRAGLFEQANHGTLLLDEINSMNIALQAKLLRVLQEGTVRRLGGASELQVDVRILSNINIPPQQAIAEKKLRQDLFYRLGVVNIDIPPLRERKEDISLLSKHFIMQCNRKMDRTVRDISLETRSMFQTYHWPGNVRELQHAIEHAINILPDNRSTILPQDIPLHIRQSQNDAARCFSPVPPQAPAIAAEEGSLNRKMTGIEYEAVCEALRQSGGNISQAARNLKMTRQNLQYKIKRYQIDLSAWLEQSK